MPAGVGSSRSSSRLVVVVVVVDRWRCESEGIERRSSPPPFGESERERGREGESEEKGSSQREREIERGWEGRRRRRRSRLCRGVSSSLRPAARRDLVRGCHEKIHLVGKVQHGFRKSGDEEGGEAQLF